MKGKEHREKIEGRNNPRKVFLKNRLGEIKPGEKCFVGGAKSEKRARNKGP